MTHAFTDYSLQHGHLAETQDDVGPSTLFAWRDAQLDLSMPQDEGSATHFGYVARGTAFLAGDVGQFSLRAGMYFSAPGNWSITGGSGIAITRYGYRGLFNLGGPIEERGRLQYIDGCSDTLLIAPVRRGDPCLNLLTIPPNVDQTAHTHPSSRLGIVVDGEGICRTHERDVPLTQGTIWAIPPDHVHSFHTNDRGLRIVAYHPDSDFGPTNQDHPMLNRTWVGGRSVAEHILFEQQKKTL